MALSQEQGQPVRTGVPQDYRHHPYYLHVECDARVSARGGGSVAHATSKAKRPTDWQQGLTRHIQSKLLNLPRSLSVARLLVGKQASPAPHVTSTCPSAIYC